MWKIYGKYRGNTELIDTTDTEEEARELQTEFLIAFGPSWDIWIEEDKEYGRIF